MTAWTWAGVMVAGAIGAAVRTLVDAAVTRRWPGAVPWGTFVVNVSGSFLFGLVTGLGLEQVVPRTFRVTLGVGACGAYTTFSTAVYETVGLLERGTGKVAGLYAAATLAASSSAAAIGLGLGAW